MKSTFYSTVFFTALSISCIGTEITGFWETLNEDTKKPSSVVAVYSYQGKFYGRIIGTYNDKGVLDDTLDHPKSKAPGIKGNPYYCGLDILWEMTPEEEGTYEGHIIDPEKGKIYDAKIWRQGDDLIVRGSVAFFGEKRTWPPFPESGFKGDFKKPDVSDFVPKKPDIID